jgi:hypothetical protein
MRFARFSCIYLLAALSPFAEETVETPDEPMAGMIQTVFNRAVTVRERLETVPLPGFPVRITELQPAGDVGIAEAPGPHNDWRYTVVRVRTRSEIVVSMVWTRIPEEGK